MRQKTIKKVVELVGIGLHKGEPIHLKIAPASVNSGITFYRVDKSITIPLSPKYVVDTKMATVIGNEGEYISTIEHFLSALYAYGIDNLDVYIDGNEMPILDGSSIGFCMLLEDAGIEYQDDFKKIIKIKDKVEVKDENSGKFVRFLPSDKALFDFSIDFNHVVIAKQSYKFVFDKENYKNEIARARTFGFMKDVQKLRSMGLALGGSLKNAIVLDDTKVLNSEGLRYKDEFVRHKILDAMGDMMLIGNILGHYESFAGSHHLNHLLTKAILKDSSKYEIITIDDTKDKEIGKVFA